MKSVWERRSHASHHITPLVMIVYTVIACNQGRNDGGKGGTNYPGAEKPK